MSLPSILQRAASYGFTSHFYDCHKKCPICFQSFQNFTITTASGKKDYTNSCQFNHHRVGAWLLPPSAPSRAAWPAWRWGPAPRTPRASRWGSCCPGWAPSRGSSPRSPPAETCLRCPGRLGVFQRLKDKTRKKKKRNVAELTRETGDVYQNLPVVRGGQRIEPATLPNLAWSSSLLWQFAVFTATTPTHPRLAPDWRRAAGRKDAFRPVRKSSFPKIRSNSKIPPGLRLDRLIF